MSSSVPVTSMYYAPEAGWERAVEGGNRFVSNYFPHIQASTAALYTRGPAEYKLRAGAKAGAEAIVFQFLVRKMTQFNLWLQEKSPWLAERVNKNPIISGILMFGTTYFGAEYGSVYAVKKGSQLLTRFFGQNFDLKLFRNGIEAMKRNRIGRGILKGASAFNKFMTKPAVMIGLGVAVTALLVGTFAKAVKDRMRFKREYKQARQQYTRKQVDPLTLRAAILLHQRMAQQGGVLAQVEPELVIEPQTAKQPNPFAVMLGPEIEYLKQVSAQSRAPQGVAKHQEPDAHNALVAA